MVSTSDSEHGAAESRSLASNNSGLLVDVFRVALPEFVYADCGMGTCGARI